MPSSAPPTRDSPCPSSAAALARRVHYLDMAMSLSRPHPTNPYRRDRGKARGRAVRVERGVGASGRIALVGMGVEPGLADVFARYAADHLFRDIDEAGVRDGANLQVEGYEFATSFSIWTTIEECLNPPVIYEKDRGWFTTEPFSEPEVFDFPEGIGPVECVNVEHEEVLLIPRWVDVKRVTFKYGLGNEFIDVLKTLHKLGLDRTEKVRSGASRSAHATSSPPACPTRRRWATACTARRAPGSGSRGTGKDGHLARPTCITWSTTNGPCGSTARRPWCGKRPSTPSSPWS